jgi:hypothetical protein
MINPAGTSNACGINFVSGKALVLEDMTIAGAGSGGVVINPASGAAASILLNRVNLINNLFGVKADGSKQTSGIIDVEVRDSVASNNTNNGFIATSGTGQAQIRFKITHSSADGNGVYGAVATGAQAFIILDGASLTGNGTGLAQINGSTIGSYGNNGVNFNATNIVGTITPTGLH